MNERDRYEIAKSVLGNGLTDYRNALDGCMRAINEWHNATNLCRDTLPSHRLHKEAQRQYDQAVSDCVNMHAIVELERLKFEREWKESQDETNGGGA